MSALPPVTPPQDFDSAVLMRTLLSTLPTVAPPEAFEAEVLRTVHRPRWTLKIVSALVGTLVITSTIFLVTNEPEIVRVKPRIDVDAPIVDLYDLPPVAVTQDTRHKDLPPAVIHKLVARLRTKPVVRAPYGVAGH